MKIKQLKYKGIPISPIVLFKTILNDENKTLDKVLNDLKNNITSLRKKLEADISSAKADISSAKADISKLSSNLNKNYIKTKNYYIADNDDIIRLNNNVYININFEKYKNLKYINYNILYYSLKHSSDKFEIHQKNTSGTSWNIIDKNTKIEYIVMSNTCNFTLINPIPKTSSNESLFLTAYDKDENKTIDIIIHY